MIHVCFGIHDKTGHYSKFTGTTMLSLFENTTSEVTVHILHDNTLTDENREKFSCVAKRYNQLVKFYNVEELCADKITEIIDALPEVAQTRFTVGMFYRFVISQIFPLTIEKVIYLDSDIIVNLNINELWQIELNDKIFAVVPEITNYLDAGIIGQLRIVFRLISTGVVKAEDYFNSGVLVMNLRLLRDEESILIKGIKFLSEYLDYSFPDQDILNYCFSVRTLHLPINFNQFVFSVRNAPKPIVEKKIYHYCAGAQGLGLGLDSNDPFNRLWMHYFMKTPWCDEKTFGKLYDSFKQSRDDLMGSMAKLYSAVSGKKRAFFIDLAKIESMKEFFSIRDDETIIPAKDRDSVQELIGAMSLSRGKNIFFIMTPKFMWSGFPFHLLTKEGFVENVDYVKGWEFLPEAHGNKFNSYPLIKAM